MCLRDWAGQGAVSAPEPGQLELRLLMLAGRSSRRKKDGIRPSRIVSPLWMEKAGIFPPAS